MLLTSINVVFGQHPKHTYLLGSTPQKPENWSLKWTWHEGISDLSVPLPGLPPPAPDSASPWDQSSQAWHCSYSGRQDTNQPLSALTHTASASTWTLTTAHPLIPLPVSQRLQPQLIQTELIASPPNLCSQGPHPGCPHPHIHSFTPDSCDFLPGSRHLSYRPPHQSSSPAQARRAL